MDKDEAIKQLKQYMIINNITQTKLANVISSKTGVSLATSQLNRWLKTGKVSDTWIALLTIHGFIA